MRSIKVRLICALMAGAVVLGGIAFPKTVRADDIEDFLDDLEDMTDDETDAFRDMRDYDHDGDIDESDVEAYETLVAIAVLDEYERQLEKEREARRRAEAEKNKYVGVTGIWVSTGDVTLTPGQTYQVVAGVKPDNARNRGVSFSTSDAGVATVDGSGVIKGNNPGSCIITASTHENGYQARVYVRVNPAPATVAQTVSADAAWMSAAANMVIAAAPGSTVNLVAAKPMSFDAGVINALKLRPDVGLLVAYPYNGHSYLMAVPAGYNLAGRMDATGKVSFLSLATVKDGKIVVVMTK